MLNISEREDELVRARVGRGQGLRLTLDLNSNWVSHGTLASDKQVNIFVKYLSKIFAKKRLHWWCLVDILKYNLNI